MLAKRKQGPVLPTLVITVADKEKRRRSSRAGFMPTTKESSSPALWFRTSPDEPSPSIQDWAQFITSRRELASLDDSGLITPNYSGHNFFSRPRDPNDYFPRPGSGNNPNHSLHHKSSTATYSTGVRERPATFSSDSPSLRSKRSDVSSPSSNFPVQQFAYAIPGQHYTTVLPTDLPSPVNTTGDYQGERTGGWTAGQGRESTVSSPLQGRESMSSHVQPSSVADSSPALAPRETILDRAFQMRHLQGGERRTPGEDKLSSVARFDALMREADERRRQKEAAARLEQMALRSAFEADDSSDDENEVQNDTDTDDGDFSDREDRFGAPSIPPPTKRALEYITGRPEPAQSPLSPRPNISRSALSFHADSTPGLTQAPPLPPARPHTAHGKTRRDTRSQSTQFLPSSLSIDTAAGPGKIPEETTPRQSSSSTKRLSFTEFTKRLSSTSSLLLVQTNTSGGSSQRNSEIDGNPLGNPRTSLMPPGPRQLSKDRDRSRDEQEKGCGWRGSVGVVGSEGGFF